MFEDMAATIMNRVPTPVAATVDVGVPVPRAVEFAKLCKGFSSLGGKQFKGTEPVEEVQRWMDACVRIFRDLGIDDATKRKLASRQLEGRAMDWWNSVTLETPEEDISWELFQAKFEAKFISTVQKSIMFRIIMELKQNSRPVLDYISDFEALSKYARSYVDTPYQKNKKFVLSLDEYIGNQLVDHLDDSFEKIFEKALRHESLFPKKMSVVAPKEEQKPQQVGNNKKRKQQQQKGKNGQKKPKSEVVCFNYQQKGHYSNECKNPKAEKNCFMCRKPGHEKKDCPGSAKGKQVVKVYALEFVPTSSRAPTAEEKGKGVMVQGTLSVNGVPVRVLFDTGASHSFNNELLCRLGFNPRFVINH